MPSGPLAPALPGANAAIPSTGLPLGTSVMLVDGQPQPVVVKPRISETVSGATEQTGLTMTGPGFLPDSEVNLYLFSEPRYLGTVKTKADGSFDGTVLLPLNVPPGRHTLQSNGYTTDGQVRSLSLGVRLDETKPAMTAMSVTRTTVVYFANSSAALAKAAKADLRTLAARVGKARARVVITGYVQDSGPSWNKTTLSTQRARAVAAYLREQGVRGTYSVTGEGIAENTGPKARRVHVIVKYSK